MAKTVLVVDDSPSEMQFILKVLAGKGYRFFTATDGDQALRQASEHTPDVVVLDVVLPKQSGFQVCRQIKNSEPPVTTKVILVSSKNQESDKFWGKKQGADAYLTKPLNAADLVAAVEDIFK